MVTVEGWLAEASDLLLEANIESARLDAELILAHTLRKPRTYLHAHADDPLDERREDIANARIQLRIDRTPVAYIIGHKWFYGRQFKTTPAALIPRPESETIITILDSIIPKNLSLLPERVHLVDVGTGTGCLGITAKLEWPHLDVTLTDIDSHALNLAKENAKALDADVQYVKANLLHGYNLPIDIVIANLPYVDQTWNVSPETKSEPKKALYATDNGLALIRKLIVQASALLKTGGHLLLESDPRQQESLITYAKEHGFTHQTTEGFTTHFVKN
jgi:release factor glutamine methyltransferase